jgi:hypothetical protein
MNNSRRHGEKKPVLKITEGDVIRVVDDFLSRHEICHWRNNTGAFKTERGGFVRAGHVGSSDFLGICPDGRFLAVECKRPLKGVLSVSQEEFLDCINRNGGVGIVVDSVDSLEKQLKDAGVIS